MARQKLQPSFRDALDSIVSREDLMQKVGASKFTTKDKKSVCFVYFRGGKIYSILTNRHIPDFVTRLYQSSDITEGDLGFIRDRFGEDWGNRDIPGFIIANHMVSEDVMDAVSQDFFLDILADLHNWGAVYSEWLSNETNTGFKIPAKPFQQVLNVIDRRGEHLQKIADNYGITPDQLNNLTYVEQSDPLLSDSTPFIFHQVFAAANRGMTVREVCHHFGLTLFRVTQTVHALWEKGALSLSLDGKVISPQIAEVKPAPSGDTAATEVGEGKDEASAADEVEDSLIIVNAAPESSTLEGEATITVTPNITRTDTAAIMSDAEPESEPLVITNSLALPRPDGHETEEVVPGMEEATPGELVEESKEEPPINGDEDVRARIKEEGERMLDEYAQPEPEEPQMDTPPSSNTHDDELDQIVENIQTRLRNKKAELAAASAKKAELENVAAEKNQQIAALETERGQALTEAEAAGETFRKLQEEYNTIVNKLQQF